MLLILRHSITLLRSLGLATILPLDNNIYLHKIVGTFIFFSAWMHTIMHLINFGEYFHQGSSPCSETDNSIFAGINVQPDPLKFVQLNLNYPSFEKLLGVYNPPQGCMIVDDLSQCQDMEMAMAEDPSMNFTLCQGRFTYDVRVR